MCRRASDEFFQFTQVIKIGGWENYVGAYGNTDKVGTATSITRAQSAALLLVVRGPFWRLLPLRIIREALLKCIDEERLIMPRRGNRPSHDLDEKRGQK